MWILAKMFCILEITKGVVCIAKVESWLQALVRWEVRHEIFEPLVCQRFVRSELLWSGFSVPTPLHTVPSTIHPRAYLRWESLEGVHKVESFGFVGIK